MSLFPLVTVWRKVTYHRKSDFRVEEESESRIVIRTRNYGLLCGGVVFVCGGVAIAWLAISKASGETATLVTLLAFAAACALFGLAAAWASRTQKDTIVVDRDLGTIRSERAKKRRKPGEDPFRIEDRPLEDLDCLGFRVAGGSAWLSFKFRNHRDVDVDNATDIEHLKALGAKLAAVTGVELREQLVSSTVGDEPKNGRGQGKAAPAQRLGDLLIAVESAKSHGLHELTDDIGVSPEGRR